MMQWLRALLFYIFGFSAAILYSIVALLLFYVMHSLVAGGDGFDASDAGGKVVDFVRVRPDEVTQTKDRRVPKKPPPPKKPQRVIVKKDKIEITEKIQFEFNKAVIKQESYSLMDEITSVIKKNQQIKKIRIEGHASSEGADAYNLELSDRRYGHWHLARYFVRAGDEKAALWHVRRAVELGLIDPRLAGDPEHALFKACFAAAEYDDDAVPAKLVSNTLYGRRT